MTSKKKDNSKRGWEVDGLPPYSSDNKGGLFQPSLKRAKGSGVEYIGPEKPTATSEEASTGDEEEEASSRDDTYEEEAKKLSDEEEQAKYLAAYEEEAKKIAAREEAKRLADNEIDEAKADVILAKSFTWSNHRLAVLPPNYNIDVNSVGSDTDDSFRSKEWEGEDREQKKLWHVERSTEKILSLALKRPMQMLLLSKKKFSRHYRGVQKAVQKLRVKAWGDSNDSNIWWKKKQG